MRCIVEQHLNRENDTLYPGPPELCAVHNPLFHALDRRGDQEIFGSINKKLVRRFVGRGNNLGFTAMQADGHTPRSAMLPGVEARVVEMSGAGAGERRSRGLHLLPCPGGTVIHDLVVERRPQIVVGGVVRGSLHHDAAGVLHAGHQSVDELAVRVAEVHARAPSGQGTCSHRDEGCEHQHDGRRRGALRGGVDDGLGVLDDADVHRLAGDDERDGSGRCDERCGLGGLGDHRGRAGVEVDDGCGSGYGDGDSERGSECRPESPLLGCLHLGLTSGVGCGTCVPARFLEVLSSPGPPENATVSRIYGDGYASMTRMQHRKSL